jgi:hypothetical protein
VDNAKLNQLAVPTATLSGSTDTNQIGNDSVTAAKAAFGAWFYCTASGTNTITLTATGHTITLTEGMIARFKVATDNTGAVDITFGGSTKDLFRYYNSTTSAGVELAAGDLRAGQQCEIIYDGTRWQLLSALGNGPVVIGTDAGSTDAYAITPSPAVRAYADLTGVPVIFKANTINTGAATLQISGLSSPPTIVKSYNATLDNGDIKAGQWVCVTYDGTNFQLLSPVTQAAMRATVPVRQTVLAGPVDSNGHPQLLSYSGQNITLAATSGSPLVVALAAGHDANGAVDYINRLTANVSNAWTLPTVDATYYLFTDRDAGTAAITYGYTTSRPSYVDDDAASITSGAHTFLINEMQMYLGDGAAAATKQRVFIGEAVVSGGAITSVTSYMFRGEFKSGSDTTLTSPHANTVYTATHKLGLTPKVVEWVLVNLTTQAGVAAGEMVPVTSVRRSTADVLGGEVVTGPNTTAARLPYGTAPYLYDAAFGLTALTATQWAVRAYAWRGW